MNTSSELSKYILIYLVLINFLGFLMMGIDKYKAKKQKWRISEKTLFLFPVLGGSLGATIGMFTFHHKTRHWYFRLGFPFLLILQTAIACYLLFSGRIIL